MRNKLRHANVGLAVYAVLLVIDLLLFYGNEEAMSAGGVFAIAVCFGVFFFLDEREYRARHPGKRDPG